MKAYWDSSALIETVFNADIRTRLNSEGGWTRAHTLSELFSALTGKKHINMDADDAAALIRALEAKLDFIDMPVREILDALDKAKSLGVRGARVHDYLHARAAEKSGAEILLTLDRNDFEGLSKKLTVEQL